MLLKFVAIGSDRILSDPIWFKAAVEARLGAQSASVRLKTFSYVIIFTCDHDDDNSQTSYLAL